MKNWLIDFMVYYYYTFHRDLFFCSFLCHNYFLSNFYHRTLYSNIYHHIFCYIWHRHNVYYFQHLFDFGIQSKFDHRTIVFEVVPTVLSQHENLQISKRRELVYSHSIALWCGPSGVSLAKFNFTFYEILGNSLKSSWYLVTFQKCNPFLCRTFLFKDISILSFEQNWDVNLVKYFWELKYFCDWPKMFLT